MDKDMIKKLTIGIIALFVGTLSGAELNELQTSSYDVCRSGLVYGTWKANNTKYTFYCDVEGTHNLCWKTTKTRCYEYDPLVLSEYINDGFTIQETGDDSVYHIFIRKTYNVTCIGVDCVNEAIVRRDLESKGII